MRGIGFLMARGEGAGDVADEMDDRPAAEEGSTVRIHLTSIMYRAAFMQELLAGVLKGAYTPRRCPFDRDGEDSPLTPRFAGGSAHNCDLHIETGGIHSLVRKLVLGADDSAISPRNNDLSRRRHHRLRGRPRVLVVRARYFLIIQAAER